MFLVPSWIAPPPPSSGKLWTCLRDTDGVSVWLRTFQVAQQDHDLTLMSKVLGLRMDIINLQQCAV